MLRVVVWLGCDVDVREDGFEPFVRSDCIGGPADRGVDGSEVEFEVVGGDPAVDRHRDVLCDVVSVEESGS